MPRYAYSCQDCDVAFDQERPIAEAGLPAPCPVCGVAAVRVFTPPRFLFKADPRDNRPYWHEHDGYGHSHPPRRGRHRSTDEDH